MEIVHTRCCGLDVHKRTVVACVLTSQADGLIERQVRTFKTMTVDLLALADWLSSLSVTHVALESTGVYWRPVYNVLEDDQRTLLLVNPQHMRAVPGKKTDVKDAEWLAEGWPAEAGWPADGHGDEISAVAWQRGRGSRASSLWCYRARGESCLGARPGVMSVAIPSGMSTWGKVVFFSALRRGRTSEWRERSWISCTRDVVGSTCTRKVSSPACLSPSPMG